MLLRFSCNPVDFLIHSDEDVEPGRLVRFSCNPVNFLIHSDTDHEEEQQKNERRRKKPIVYVKERSKEVRTKTKETGERGNSKILTFILYLKYLYMIKF